MSIRPNASTPRKTSGTRRFGCLVLLTLYLVHSLPFFAHADETIVVTLTLNEEKRGDAFVVMRDDGDFLVGADDLTRAGITSLPGERVEIDGVPHVSLRSLTGANYRFDPATLTLRLTVSPELLPKATLDLAPARRNDVIIPRDRSFFLNYGLDYSAGGESFDFTGFSVGNEFGLRLPDLLLLTDTLYTSTPDRSRFVRLNTSLTWDDRQQLRRLIVGDFVTEGGELGSQLRMGGLALSKAYRIDPYFIRYPLFGFSGQVALPSEVEIYLDGIRTRSEHFAPGAFELRNLQGIGGARTVEIVIRDTLGREQRIVVPYYFTDQLLRRGLHEYAYQLGMLRDDYGLESNRYDAPALSAFHRYGLTDWSNLGGHLEGGDGLVNAGVEGLFKLGAYGQVRLAGAGSSKDGRSGSSLLFGYELQSSTYRAVLGCQSSSQEYRTLASPDSGQRTKLSLRAGLGYNTPKLGSLDLDISRQATFKDGDRTIVALSWARRLLPGTYLNSYLRRIDDPEQTAYEVLLNLTWTLDRSHTVTGTVSHTADIDQQVVEVHRDLPGREGDSWSLRAEHSTGGGETGYLLSGAAQHNARSAILRSDLGLGKERGKTTSDLRLNLSGGMVYLSDTFALTRPVTDSFTLVRVGEQAGVGVKINGLPTGHTDDRGQLVVPELSSYFENQISIEDRDLPIDTLVQQVRFNISPPLRSGSCINFPVQRYRAYTGTLLLVTDGQRAPLADAELTLATPEGTISFWSDGSGEFYIDNQSKGPSLEAQQGCLTPPSLQGTMLPAGSYPVIFRHGQLTYRAEVTIPAATEPYVELGTLELYPIAAPLPPGSDPSGPG